MDATTYACPACGGLVDEGARRCPYCEAPVASVRCGLCFHMNVPGTLHCSGCGREMGLEPVAEPGTLSCPICKGETLQVVRSGPGLLHDCGKCGGQFVEQALLEELLAEREPALPIALRQPPRPALADLRAAYVPCPVCKALMGRKNFGGSSGVIIDVCRRHGVWFDAGELPRVLAYVHSGGLTGPEAASQRASVVSPAGRPVRYDEAHGAEHRTPRLPLASVDDVADAGRALLKFLRELVIR
jgi:Zn-finger nucleic acid-binding protein